MIKLQISTYLLITAFLTILLFASGTYYYHNQYTKELAVYTELKNTDDQLKLILAADDSAITKLKRDSDQRAAKAHADVTAAWKKVHTLNIIAQGVLATPAVSGVSPCVSAKKVFNTFILKKVN